MCFLRRILRVSYKEQKTNDQVLCEATVRKLFNKIKQRQCRFICLAMRGEEMENLVATSNIQGKRDRNRQRLHILDGVCKRLGVKDNKGIFRDVPERIKWRNMIVNAFRARDIMRY
jgi:ribosomal 50S subunit-associated protein YjgA (DUF615 family)